MRKFLTVFVAAAIFVLPSRAQTAPLIAADGVAEKITQRYIETQGWCDRPAPAAKPGQIVIYYARDEQGLCTARIKAAPTVKARRKRML